MSWALVPLRLAIGAGLVMHGIAKLVRGPEHFADVVTALGMPAPLVMAWLVIALEILCGLAILTGAFVRPAAIAMAPIVAAAIVGVHWRYGFLSVRLVSLGADGATFGPVGYELGLIYLAALVALALGAPTPWSIDRWRHARSSLTSAMPTPR